MRGGLEREIKLRFDDAVAIRARIERVGGAPLRARRLQRDWLLDTADGLLRNRRSVLRVRIEEQAAFLTFKGPVQPGTTKLREETEVTVGDGEALLMLLDQAGFAVWFRYEKFREEFTLEDAVVAIDETPVGTFVEVEGAEEAIARAAAALGRGPADYVLDSYRALFLRACEETGHSGAAMVFEAR